MSLIRCLLVLCTFCFADDAATQPSTSSLVGQPAPALNMSTLDGKSVKLSDEKGHVVIVDFWATWCIPCRQVLPHLQKYQDDKDLAAKGLKVWAVDVVSKNETKPKVQKFVDENKYTFTVPLDEDSKARESYLISTYPTTVVIGRDGKVRNVFMGYENPDDLKKLDEAVEAALKEAP